MPRQLLIQKLVALDDDTKRTISVTIEVAAPWQAGPIGPEVHQANTDVLAHVSDAILRTTKWQWAEKS